MTYFLSNQWGKPHQANTAQTIEELLSEIQILKGLESKARDVVLSGQDRKWEELSSILQDNELIFDAQGNRRKLIIFTEHKDTLNYLHQRITALIGDPDCLA